MHMELIETAGNNAKTATQVVRTMTLLTRSFESEGVAEVKSAFRDVTQTILGILRTQAKNAVARDAVILYFHRMIIVMGTEVLPLLQQLINLLVENRDGDVTVLSAIIKIEVLALVSWKERAMGFVRELEAFVLGSVLALGFPASKISDGDRAVIEAAYNYEKLVKTILLIDSTTLFHEPIDRFTALLGYIGRWTVYRLDESVRRLAVGIVVMLLAGSVGLIVSTENVTALLDQTADSERALALFSGSPMHARALVQKAEECAVSVMEVIDPNQPMDAQACNDLAVLHCLLYRATGKTFADKLEVWGQSNGLPDCAKMRPALDGVCNGHTAKEYKDLVRQIVLIRIKKG